jgi:hypothetical protein
MALGSDAHPLVIFASVFPSVPAANQKDLCAASPLNRKLVFTRRWNGSSGIPIETKGQYRCHPKVMGLFLK